MSASLTLSLRQPGKPITAVNTSGDGRYVIDAEKQWRLDGPSDAVALAREQLDPFVELIAPTTLLLSFGNSVGVFEVPGLGSLVVRSGKWSDSDFDAMLADVVRIASGLPFSAGSRAPLPFERSVPATDDVLYHAFVYLRFILSATAPFEDRLPAALAAIAAEPHRLMIRNHRSVPFEAATDIDVHGLLALATARDLMAAPGLDHPLALALDGHLPRRHQDPVVHFTLDTAENRFVKAFLRRAVELVGRMRLAAGKIAAPYSSRIRLDCDAMTGQLEGAVRHSMWREVGGMTHVPMSSTVLQGRRGYRDVFRHSARLTLATRNLPLSTRDTRKLLEAKDIALLYELWCCFVVAEAITRQLGRPRRADSTETTATEKHIARGFSVAWSGGVELHYNAAFSHSRKAPWHSYSVPLRPDLVLKTPDGALHLFDAKFRLVRFFAEAKSDEEELEATDEEERRGTFKRADLYKMHTYLDAIPAARAVRILYPGDKSQFYLRPPATGDAASGAARGVGATPLVPGKFKELDLVLADLLKGNG